jgi:light-regulated signal transduction histidine kinase (bacteriophytochrome)
VLADIAEQRATRLREQEFSEGLPQGVAIAGELIQLRDEEEALQQANDELEIRVQERTAELQASHAEMEAFTYTVSHDLRAPLRTVQGFAAILGKDYSGLLDDSGKDCIQRIVGGTMRMDELIQDLLAYSRLARVELDMVAVNTTQLVRGILQTTTTITEDRGAIITVQDDMPAVLANDRVLSHVISNLLTNAAKFVAPDVTPRVEVTAETREDRVRLWVSDNGIGIAPEHHGRIFKVCERLHGVEAYPGTGIGLAIVQRGVERMGGRCGVEATPGAGSRFWVELAEAGPVS